MNPDTRSVSETVPAPDPADSGVNEKEISLCWNCGSAEFETLFQARDFDTALDGFPVRRCRQCELCYTGEVTQAVLAASYSRAYYGSEKAKFVPLIETLVSMGHRRLAKKILGLYHGRQSAPNIDESALSVMDIGCGRALLLQEFSKLGTACLGIERDEFPGTAPRGVDVHIGALGDEELSGRRFDIIIIWHVLEHITDLGSLLKELPAHLNPGGLLVISVPNFSSWQSRFFRQHWFHLDIPRHVTHFEKEWLQKKLTSLGMDIVSQNTFTASQNVFGFIQSSLNKIFPRKPNRFYKSLTRGNERKSWLSLTGWTLLAIPLALLAVLETLLSESSHRGATLSIYARYRGQEGGAQSSDN